MNTGRWIPMPTAEDKERAVLMARAVVGMDETIATQLAALDDLRTTLAARDRSLKDARERVEDVRKLLVAVQHLHSELDALACAGGCCHEGTGVCSYCDEPWPCKTYRVAKGHDHADVARPVPPVGGDGA